MRVSISTAVSVLAAISTICSAGHAQSSENTRDETWVRAQAEARARIERRMRPQQARNVILFVADGMSIPTITAARIFDGQENGLGQDDVEHLLSFESFPDAALVRTYSTNAQVPDSANTATAMVTGVKTRNGALSVRGDQFLDVCDGSATPPATLVELAEDRGMATGIISTARITHATPAATFAHSASRQWELDTVLPEEAVAAGCEDIASQLLSFDRGDGLDIVLGGGRQAFLPEEAGGRRGDGRNLMQEWADRGGATATTAQEFRALRAEDDAPVLGLFTGSHLAFEADRINDEEPSLAELTSFAIDRLERDDDGYVLLVEAGRVDHAHHATNAYRAFTDMQAFADAIAAAVERVDLDETLILVTADHGHTMTISGYPARGNPILGLVRSANMDEPGAEPSLTFDATGRPYTTIGYANGPNTRSEDDEALTEEEVLDPGYRQEATVRRPAETHSGADVALFANGPRSHYFSGSMEQNTIFHLITAALGWESDEASQD